MPTPALTVLEEDRHWWFMTRTRAILKVLDAELGPRNGTPRRVLDIGAGAGNMAHHLAHYGEVIGLDYNARPLPVAKARALTTSQASGEQLPFPDASFDLVALLDTVEHIPNELGVFAECVPCAEAGRCAACDRAGFYVAVELQRRDQRASAPLHDL